MIIGILTLALIVASAYVAFDDPGAPPAELQRIKRGMPSAEVIAMLGEPTQHGFEGSIIDCMSWELPRGMVVVVLDERKNVASVTWVAKHQSETRGFVDGRLG
jgi:hypothetical protein